MCALVKVRICNASHIDLFYKFNIFPFSDLKRFLVKRPGACSNFFFIVNLTDCDE